MKTVSLAIRVYVDGALHSTEYFEASLPQLDVLLPRLAQKHARLAAWKPTMVEIEFLGEPDVNQRFFRIGSDPRGMVRPLGVEVA